MKFNKYNLNKLLKEEWFIEFGNPHLEGRDLIEMPSEITLDNKIADTLYEPSSFLGFNSLELHKEESGYYLRQIWQEPIGDYGTQWYVQWYQCINNEEVDKIFK